MKKLMQKIEDLMVAITFAEAGEFETAIALLGDERAEDLTLSAEKVKVIS